MDAHIREVCESLLTKLGYSPFEIAQKLIEFEEQDSDQLVLYDSREPVFEQMLLEETGLTIKGIKKLME